MKYLLTLMLKKILVVESPNKTREISHMKLGVELKATLGHIMDLPWGKEIKRRIAFQNFLCNYLSRSLADKGVTAF